MRRTDFWEGRAALLKVSRITGGIRAKGTAVGLEVNLSSLALGHLLGASGGKKRGPGFRAQTSRAWIKPGL